MSNPNGRKEAVGHIAFCFEVPLRCKPPTPNSRLHYMARARMSKALRADVGIVGRSARNDWGMPVAKNPRHLALTLITPKGSRMLDDDNLRAACKPLLDGCKDAGLIVDDSPQWVTVEYAQERGQNLAVHVEIEAS